MKAPKVRNYDYMSYVRTHPCCLCGEPRADAHHHSRPHAAGMGQKDSDLTCIPLCREHHQDLHHARLDAADLDRCDDARLEMLMGYIEVHLPHLFKVAKPRTATKAKPATPAPKGVCQICRYPVPGLHRRGCDKGGFDE